jgi:hypothetical protein
VAIYICWKRMFVMFHLISDACYSKCRYPRAMTCGHVRCACTQPVPISVIQASSNSGRARNRQPVSKRPSTPWSNYMHACRAPERANMQRTQCTARRGPPWCSICSLVNTGVCTLCSLFFSHVAGRGPHAHALPCRHSSRRGQAQQ